jgi:hypothetical protein
VIAIASKVLFMLVSFGIEQKLREDSPDQRSLVILGRQN